MTANHPDNSTSTGSSDSDVQQTASTGGFERHARSVSLLTAASRVTGLVRDAAFSRVFGAGPLMDAFFFAFMLPNLFRRLFGEGALAAAFLPVYAGLHRDDPMMARRVASLVVARLLVVLGGATLLGEGVLYVISANLDHANPAIWLMMITLPYMPLVCLVAMLGAMLQVHQRFGPTAAAPIVLNFMIIATTIGLPYLLVDDEHMRLRHVGLVATSVVVAGLLQVSWSMWALRRAPWWTSNRQGAKPHGRTIAKQAMPMVLGLGVLQLNTLLDGFIASYPTTVGSTIFGVEYPLQEGAMAAISYAQRLYQFPLGVFGIAVATAIFPMLARYSNDEHTFASTVRRGLRLVVFIGLPASVGLMLVGDGLADVIFRGGKFSDADAARVSFVLLGYAPAVWSYSMTHVLTRTFYAKGDSVTPVRIALSVVGLNLLLNCTLIWTPLREAGLGWSTSICSIVQVLVLLHVVKRHVDKPVDGDVMGSWMRTVIASAVMAGAVALCHAVLPDADSWWPSLYRLLALVTAGIASFAAMALLQSMPEWKWALGRSNP